MLPLQCKAGCFVLEFEIQAQRRPAFGRVAIATCYFYFAMGMIHGSDLSMCLVKWQ
jgi:hypothetical protein